jgi:hypothetical protein
VWCSTIKPATVYFWGQDPEWGEMLKNEREKLKNANERGACTLSAFQLSA